MTHDHAKNKTGEPAHRSRRSATRGTPLLIFAGMAVAFLLLSAPASAGTKYMAGTPELSAHVSGTNEFSPGDSVSLPITIENTGVNEFKFVQSGIVDRDDLPNTAKFLNVTLEPGDAPLVIKSDPQMAGDLKGSSTTTCIFSIKVLSDAPAGTYMLPVLLQYRYLYQAEQYGIDSIRYAYKDVNETVSLPITIKPHVRIQVVSAETGQVNAGTEGSVKFTVQNIGHEDGKKAVLKMGRNDNSPVIPTQSSVYIGDFPAGRTVSGTFRVTASDDAEEQVYPVDIFVSYENSEGDTVTSDTEIYGVPVGRKVEFSIVSDPAGMTAGQKKTLTVLYKNTGGATVYNAQARISAVDPFTCSDDTAFLGTIAPGETKEADFMVSVAGSATPKEYGLDSEIRFRDSLDNNRISDPLKVRIRVGANPGVVGGLVQNPLLLGILVVLCIVGIAGYVTWNRKRSR
jgi:hypothetical protein